MVSVQNIIGRWGVRASEVVEREDVGVWVGVCEGRSGLLGGGWKW